MGCAKVMVTRVRVWLYMRLTNMTICGRARRVLQSLLRTENTVWRGGAGGVEFLRVFRAPQASQDPSLANSWSDWLETSPKPSGLRPTASCGS